MKALILNLHNGEHTRLACHLRRRAANLFVRFIKSCLVAIQMNEAIGVTPTTARGTRALPF